MTKVTKFCYFFRISSILSEVWWSPKLKENLVQTLKLNIRLEFSCEVLREEFINAFYNHAVDLFFFAWTKGINGFMNGSDLKVRNANRENQLSIIQQKALKIYTDRLSFNKRRYIYNSVSFYILGG